MIKKAGPEIIPQKALPAYVFMHGMPDLVILYTSE